MGRPRPSATARGMAHVDKLHTYKVPRLSHPSARLWSQRAAHGSQCRCVILHDHRLHPPAPPRSSIYCVTLRWRCPDCQTARPWCTGRASGWRQYFVKHPSVRTAPLPEDCCDDQVVQVTFGDEVDHLGSALVKCVTPRYPMQWWMWTYADACTSAASRSRSLGSARCLLRGISTTAYRP